MKRKISHIEKTKNAMEVISLLAMAGSFALFGYIYSVYPEGIPVFSPVFAWTLDNVKSELFTPLFISSAVFIFLFMLYRFPRYYRYPVEITAENIERQYFLAKIMLSSEIIITAFAFSACYIIMYFLATGRAWQPSWYSVWAFPSAASAAVILYFILARKGKKQ